MDTPPLRDDELREMLTPAVLHAARRMVEALDATLAGEPDYGVRLEAARAVLERLFGERT